MRTVNVLALADFIELTPGRVNYLNQNCVIGWTGKMLSNPNIGAREASTFLGLHYDNSDDDSEAVVAFFAWPRTMFKGTLRPGEFHPDVRDLLILNLRHWASVGRVEWIDSLGQPIDRDGDPVTSHSEGVA